MMTTTGVNVRIRAQAYRALGESDFATDPAWERIHVYSLGEHAYLKLCAGDLRSIQKKMIELARRIQATPYPAQSMTKRVEQEALLGAAETLEFAAWRAGLTRG